MTTRRRVIPPDPSAYDGHDQPTASVSLGAQPEFEIPDVPRDITVISDKKLMTLFSEYTAWQNFAATRLAEAEVEEERAEAAVRYEEAVAMSLAPATAKVTVTRAQTATSKTMQAARDRQLEAYATRKMTQVVFANCERVVALISRELTRRVGREGTDRRMNRWQP
jgi:hypothetical protein